MLERAGAEQAALKTIPTIRDVAAPAAKAHGIAMPITEGAETGCQADLKRCRRVRADQVATETTLDGLALRKPFATGDAPARAVTSLARAALVGAALVDATGSLT